MTHKERLENIDKRAKHKVLENIKEEIKYRLTEINTEDYEWLIEQAKRVQELENHIDYLYDNNVHLKGDYKLQEQNKRYREALELIVKQETLGKDVKTGKTAISYNGMIALKGLGIFNDDVYTVYGVDEVIESVSEGSE